MYSEKNIIESNIPVFPKKIHKSQFRIVTSENLFSSSKPKVVYLRPSLFFLRFLKFKKKISYILDTNWVKLFT